MEVQKTTISILSGKKKKKENDITHIKSMHLKSKHTKIIENDELNVNKDILEKTLFTVLENTIESIIVINSKYKIVYANSTFCNIFNIEWEKLVNTDFREHFDGGAKEHLIESYRNGINGTKEKFCYELKFELKSGKTKYFELNSFLIKDEYNMIYTVAQLRDITNQKIIEEDLVNTKEMAEKADKLKSEFLGQISHEIRTPINTLLSFSSLLKMELENQVTEDLRTVFVLMERAGKRIIRTIDQVLNMSEIQTGGYNFTKTKFDVYNAILYPIYKEYKDSSVEKNINFQIINKNSNAVVNADQYGMYRVFENLIDNAIKYTKMGEVTVTLGHDSGGRVVVDVSDTGVGISKEYLPKIFENFTQEEQGYTRKYEGNGLGLTLVKKYCELNEAKINVVSEKGIGTKIRIIFPELN